MAPQSAKPIATAARPAVVYNYYGAGLLTDSYSYSLRRSRLQRSLLEDKVANPQLV